MIIRFSLALALASIAGISSAHGRELITCDQRTKENHDQPRSGSHLCVDDGYFSSSSLVDFGRKGILVTVFAHIGYYTSSSLSDIARTGQLLLIENKGYYAGDTLAETARSGGRIVIFSHLSYYSSSTLTELARTGKLILIADSDYYSSDTLLEIANAGGKILIASDHYSNSTLDALIARNALVRTIY